MADRSSLPQVDLGQRQVPQLSRDSASHHQPGPSDLRSVQQPAAQLVSQRVATAPDPRPTAPPAELHFALVINDRKAYNYLVKGQLLLIAPPDWTGHADIRIIIAKEQENPETLVSRIALLQLDMIDPKVANLTGASQVSLGWPTE